MAQNIVENTKAEEGKEYCINNHDGICLAVAGPGTGKTYAIANRIKNIIKKGCPSDRILCLTFTDTASSQMVKGIKDALEKDNITVSNMSVNVCTFHSFCMEIIKTYSGIFELNEGIKVIPDSVKRIFITDLIEEIQSEYLITEAGSRLQYLDAIIKGIEDIKKYNYSKEEYEKNLNNFENEKDRNKASDLWKFYEKYEEKKLENNYIDFSDMIITVVKKFKNDRELLKTIAESYDYILVDEYQDTNPMQNEIIYELGEFCENIFAVGDDDQTIFSFQGADIVTMKEFIKHFENKGKKVEVVTFNGNRRSTKNIIDVSRSIVLIQKDYNRYIITKQNLPEGKKKENALNYKQIFTPLEWDDDFKDYKGRRINKELTAVNDKSVNDPVYLTEYENEEKEQSAIIEKIKELAKTTPLSEIAVLSRSNKELEEYAYLLKKNNIDYELKDGKNIFEINSVNILVSYLELLVNPDVFSGKFLSYLLSPVFHINPDDYITIFKNRAHSNIIKTMEDILEGRLENKKFVDKDRIMNFLKIYNNLNDNLSDGLVNVKEGTSLEEIILLALNETGILEYYVSKIETGKVENLLGLKKFVEEARGYWEVNKSTKGADNLAGFLKYIKDLNNDGVKISTDKPNYKYDAIQLSTYHSSKGKEYKYVFMPSLNGKKWESRSGGGGIKINVPFEEDVKIQNKKIEIEQEKLPKYVLTDWVKPESKVMELVKLMFVGITRAKEGLFLSYTEANEKASTFIKILKEDFENREKQLVVVDENREILTEEENIEALSNWLKIQRYDYKKDFKELIDYKFNNMEYFSPTALNCWLNCKRRFLYEKVLKLGDDRTQNGASFGTAIHNTFEKVAKFIRDNKTIPTREKIKEEFNRQMSTLDFDPKDVKDINAMGKTTLDNYYEIIQKWNPDKLFYIEEGIEKFEIDGEKFTVKIDRIDENDDGTYTIYDYKTTSKKSKSEVTLDGKSSDYFNQLAFYKYVFHKKENILLDKIKTALIFPKDSSELEVEISEEDCLEVKKRYFETIKALKELKFDKAEESEAEKACKYCSCKAFCSLEVFKD